MTPEDVQKSSSLGQMLERSCRVNADRVAQMRPQKDGYHSVTYAQLWPEVFAWAKAIDAFGLKAGDRVAIIGETCWQWAVADWACQTLGLVTVPIYPTLPADQAQYIADDAEVKLVLAQDNTQADKLRGYTTALFGASDGSGALLPAAVRSDLTDESWRKRIGEVEIGDIATIIYTSGTTGNPKGVMLAHRAFLSLNPQIHGCLPIQNTDIFLSFLPLSHVFERYAGHILPIATGACVAYANSLASLAKDMQAVRPTIMLCVPRFLEATMGRIKDAAQKQKPLSRKLFNAAIEQGTRRDEGKAAPMAGVLDALVGRKIRARTGGRIRFFVSGGAALPPHVSKFFSALGLTVLQGYGLTETCAASCCNRPGSERPETVGPPVAGVEIKLAEDGEILIRGDSVMLGYHKLPEETAAVIDNEGWFHSGDIGEWTPEGHIKITDRKKDIIVLANGKNIAPQPIENHLKESPYIGEAVVFGDGSAYCYALIVPDFEAVKAWLKETDGVDASEGLAERSDVKDLIKKEVDRVNKRLADFEKIKRHALLETAFTIEGGELTPSLKVKRKVIRERYSALLDTLSG